MVQKEKEFSRWRSGPENERSEALAWWWQPALEVVTQQEQMPPKNGYRMLRGESLYRAPLV